MLESCLCDYSDAYISVKGTITHVEQGADSAAIQVDRNNKQVTFKNSAPFNDCISKINNIQIEHAKDLDVVMPMYKSIKYSDNYSRITASSWQYDIDEPKNHIIDYNSFKFNVVL